MTVTRQTKFEKSISQMSFSNHDIIDDLTRKKVRGRGSRFISQRIEGTPRPRPTLVDLDNSTNINISGTNQTVQQGVPSFRGVPLQSLIWVGCQGRPLLRPIDC